MTASRSSKYCIDGVSCHQERKQGGGGYKLHSRDLIFSAFSFALIIYNFDTVFGLKHLFDNNIDCLDGSLVS